MCHEYAPVGKEEVESDTYSLPWLRAVHIECVRCTLPRIGVSSCGRTATIGPVAPEAAM